MIGLAVSPLALADSWEGSIGAGVAYAPDYLGSDDYDTRLLPSLQLSYGDTLSISPRSGIEWHAIRNGSWTVSPFIGYTFGRNNKGDISAFEKVDGGATLGVRVGYAQRAWYHSIAASTPITGDMDGTEFEVASAWRAPLSERLFLSVSPSVHYGNEKWTESLFGVSAHDSERSGIATYDPGGGYWRLGLSSSLTYALTPEWSATGFVGASYLTANASDSPIVEDLGSEWQTITGISLNYSF
ncbi:MAG: MipA/OmpV family protein [Halomonas sp.]|nr:MAG: MipA/OmpV family protein [Halomonas sp.]